MRNYEVRSGQFGLVSGIQQPASDMVLVSEPSGLFVPEARKGQLCILVEADDVERGRDACQLVIKTVRRHFYDDSSLSVTSSLRQALIAANRALYQQNFSAPPQKRAAVGITCAVLRDGDLYIAQVLPSQAYVLAGGRIRMMPSEASGASAALLRPGAVGASLTIEPEFYRATLRPGDAILICSSNLARNLDEAQVLRLLRSFDPAEMIGGLSDACADARIQDAHGLAITICAPLSAAARAGRSGGLHIGQRSWAFLRSTGDRISRATGDLVLLARGPQARRSREQAETRRERSSREQDQLRQLPDEVPYAPDPLPMPHPLDLGEPLAAPSRAALPVSDDVLLNPNGDDIPMSVLLGEMPALPGTPTERRVDLSDTPEGGVLDQGIYRLDDAVLPNAPLGERLLHPFRQAISEVQRSWRRRRIRRPTVRPIAPRRNIGLSYRHQRPPFPWLLLLLLVSLVAVLVLYGINLSRENDVRETIDTFQLAEQAITDLQTSPDEVTAQQRLEVAAQALAKLRETGAISVSVEARQRFDELEREYDRTYASIYRLSYLDNLTELARHPLGGQFTGISVSPPPGAITNTASFNAIYLLDSNAGALYRLPKDGGIPRPILSPQDRYGPLPVGQVRGQTWRFDNVVAVAQIEDGSQFTYYFPSGTGWNYSTLAGSEEWGRVDQRFRVVNYEGNLYIWGVAEGNVLRYLSGQFGSFPLPWIQNDGGQQVDKAVDLAVDGKIYLLMPEGRVLVFSTNEAGERGFEREIAVPTMTPPVVVINSFFLTGGPEDGFVFLVDGYNGRIIQLEKTTGRLIQQLRVRPDGLIQFDQLSHLFVDTSTARPTLYLINGGQILETPLPDPPRPFRDPSQRTPQPTPVPQNP